jgi:hypothetical protein
MSQDSSPSTVKPEAEPVEAKGKEPPSSWIKRLFRLSSGWRSVVLSLLVSAFLAAIIALSYICWIWLLPMAWNWGFAPTTWRGILSVIFAFYLVLIPFCPFYFVQKPASDILDLFLEAQEEKRTRQVQENLTRLQGNQVPIDSDQLRDDKSSLMPIIHYSRKQLDSYYSIGLEQTERSFRYSIIAMWIGFLVIVVGIAIVLMPSATARTTDLHIITIASGTVIELVSGLFLWVYRSSIKQLNYFYDRQMVLHSILLCDRISGGMTNPDAMRKLIIENILENTWERRASPHFPLPTPKPDAKVEAPAEKNSPSKKLAKVKSAPEEPE